jgi:hypothetical protein
MFKIIVLAAVATLFWTSAPARQVAADVLDSASDIIEPNHRSPGRQLDRFVNQFTN